MVGPEESDAPLYVRQNVYILDVHPKARDVLEIPEFEGLKPFLYVLDGEIEVKELTIGKQEAVNDFENALPALTANADSAVVLFYGCFDVYERNNQWVREKIKLDRKHPI
ncbi:hypothetical protein CIL03_17105 [Virgibacillus indicus]|uniref:Quercetin 2,3-dioxygenase C-terminal cupin domain-containing protein n=2 Tax=Virgibacillus indicus TaxID=2024554 RepID=A0A265N660_9BACI|nr:hypothetical protein CIL03_17105 [Virgibacillus indicus]